MKVSVNTIQKYIDTTLPSVSELVAVINAQLGQVEEVIELAPKYAAAKIVKVVECEKHPNADRLSVCKIDDGSGELTQVVCGAPNVRAGMWAVWLPPESVVPSTYGTDEEFKLGARELRGVMSNGMLASGKELDINSSHEGIIEVTTDDVPVGETLREGAGFSEMFGLDDTIIDIENKMFTHRPDLFGQLGVAREISAILQGVPAVDQADDDTRFANPDWYWSGTEFQAADGLDLEVFNDAKAGAPRFMAVAMRGVTVRPSPLWLQCELVRWGGKPINNVVDMTNYVMLLTAQPVHAYDYKKLRGHKLGVRMAEQGETLTLLNDKTYTLNETDLVIADGEGAVGLAGVMGGGNSEVSEDTTDVVLEVATFDMYAVRRTSMRYGLFTDALTRFNKGQSPLQNGRILGHLMTLLQDIAGAAQASKVYDLHALGKDFDSSTLKADLTVGVTFVNQRLGIDLTAQQIGSVLRRVNFAVIPDEKSSDILQVTPPYWRTDIAIPEDVVEEVGRLYGYDNLPRELPMRSARPTPTNRYRELTERVRQALSRAGGNEVLTYSFVHERVLRAVGQDVDDAYQLSNALSPDLQYYRLSLTPSLLDKVHMNIKAGYDEFALFEIGKSHSKKAGVDDDKLPIEPGRIALTYAAKTPRDGAPYYRVKYLLDYAASQLGMELEYRSLPSNSQLAAAAPFVAARTARVIDRVSGQPIGLIGEYTQSARKAFKLPEYAAGFELFTEGLLRAADAIESRYRPLSRYPSIERDVCFEVATEVSYGDIISSMQLSHDDGLHITVDPVDIYQAEDGLKRVTVRVRVTSHERTMTSKAAGEVVDGIAAQVIERTGASII